MAETQSQNLPVVWQEGMLLSPQHFQQFERASQQRLAQRASFLLPHGWGLGALEIDEQALAHGRFSVLRAAGVFPDGTSFDTAQGDPLPAPRDLGPWFESQRDRLELHLGLPLPRAGQPLIARDAGTTVPGPRFTSRLESVPDDLAEGVDREIALAAKNLVVLFPDEALSQHERLGLGEVVRTSTGFAMRDQFGGTAPPAVPPLLALEGSKTLHGHVRRMLNLLLDRSRELSDLRTQRGSAAEFGRSDMPNFMQLLAVNSHIPTLSNFVQKPVAHPQAVFAHLASLAGALCSFNANFSPHMLPTYEHATPGTCFTELCGVLEELLRDRPTVNGKRFDLVRKPGSVHVAALDEAKVLEARGHLFVGVCIEGADRAQVLLSFKRKVKIASENKVAQLIAAALPGLNLHDPAPVPGGVPSMAGYDYFELDRSHPLWDDVRRASNVGVYLPRDMEQLKLDLVGNWE